MVDWAVLAALAIFFAGGSVLGHLHGRESAWDAAYDIGYGLGLQVGRAQGYTEGEIDRAGDDIVPGPRPSRGYYCQFCNAKPANIDPEQRCSLHEDVEFGAGAGGLGVER